MLESQKSQNEHFGQDFLKFSHFAATKSTFSSEFSHEPQNLLAQNQCFVWDFREFSSHLTNGKPATEFAHCHHLTHPWQCDSQKNTRNATPRHVSAPATQNDDGGLQSAAPAAKNATHLLTTMQEYCACHTKRLQTRYETCWNVTKCHARHAKRGYATFETSKSDHFCRTRHRHGHITSYYPHDSRSRTLANGCGHKSNVEQTRLNPQTPKLKRDPFQKNAKRHQQVDEDPAMARSDSCKATLPPRDNPQRANQPQTLMGQHRIGLA